MALGLGGEIRKRPGDVAVRDIIDMLCSIPEDLFLPADAGYA